MLAKDYTVKRKQCSMHTFSSSLNLIYEVIVKMIYCSTNIAAKNTLLQNYDSMLIDRFNGGLFLAWPKTCVG